MIGDKPERFARLWRYLCHKQPWWSRGFRSFLPSDSHRSDFLNFAGLLTVFLRNWKRQIAIQKRNLSWVPICKVEFESPLTDDVASSVGRKELDVLLHSLWKDTPTFNSIGLDVILERTHVFSWRIIKLKPYQSRIRITEALSYFELHKIDYNSRLYSSLFGCSLSLGPNNQKGPEKFEIYKIPCKNWICKTFGNFVISVELKVWTISE